MVVGLAALLGAYVWAFRRSVLSAADDVSPWLPGSRWRPAMFAGGLLIAYLALQSPIDRGGDDYLFSIHMVQHLLLMMVAPPLLLLGICGSPALGADIRLFRSRCWRALTAPWPAAALFTTVLLVWHIPNLYDATLTTEPIHVVEHLTFVAAGLVFWWPVVDPIRGRGHRRIGPFEKIAVLVVSGIPPTVLGLLFALARRPFYDFYARAPRLWGIGAVTDQQVAGVIMFGAGNLIYFLAISLIFLRILGETDPDEALEEPGGATAAEDARGPRHGPAMVPMK